MTYWLSLTDENIAGSHVTSIRWGKKIEKDYILQQSVKNTRT
jgi:hypothetical protein